MTKKVKNQILGKMLCCIIAFFVLTTPTAMAATGWMTVGNYVPDLTVNASDAGWSWTAATNTLELNSAYSGFDINIQCASTDNINLVYTGDVSVVTAGTSAIHCGGGLTINGSGGTLTLGASESAITFDYGSLTINSGTIVMTTTSTNSSACSILGAMKNVTIGGSANVTINSNAIGIAAGNVTISTTGEVNIATTAVGLYSILAPFGSVNVSNGTVNIRGAVETQSGDINHTGGTLNYNPAPLVNGIIVSAQKETLMAGIPGNVTFDVATSQIAPGDYTVTVDNRPAGITVQGQVTISGNLSGGSGILTLAGDASTIEGTTNTLTLTIDGITSDPFTLKINAKRIYTSLADWMLKEPNNLTDDGDGNYFLNFGATSSSSSMSRGENGPIISLVIGAGETLIIPEFCQLFIVDGGSLTGTGDIISNSTTDPVVFEGGGTCSVNISGTGSMNKYGSGTLALSGSNDIDMTVWQGMVEVADSYTIPAGKTFTVQDGATLAVDGDFTVNGAIVNSGAITVNSGGQLATGNTGGSVAGSGNIVNNGSLSVGSTSSSYNIVGVISGTGNLFKIGAGTLTLFGNNTYTGKTVVNSGTLLIAGSWGTGGNYSGDITINDNATLALYQSANQTLSGTIANNNGVLYKEGAFALTIANSISGSGGSTDFNGAGIVTINGVQVYPAIADTTPPTVASVTPSGADAATSGNVVVTFSEAMNNTTPGTVQLNSLTALTGGTWSGGNTVFTIPYSGLDNSVSYTVNISGFKDAAGNAMTANSNNSFTTISLVYQIIKIGGGGVTDISQNDGGAGWTWTASSKTINLNENYTGEKIAIYCAAAVNIVYSGNVTVSNSDTPGDSEDDGVAIYSEGPLVIGGSGGKLNIISFYAKGIYADGDITISDKIDIFTNYQTGIYANSGSFAISNGTIGITSNYAGGISANGGNVAINSSTIEISCQTAGIYADGGIAISGSAVGITSSVSTGISAVGDITINGSTINITSPTGHGINGRDVKIDGGAIYIDSKGNGIQGSRNVTIGGGSGYIKSSDDVAVNASAVLTVAAGIKVMGNAGGGNYTVVSAIGDYTGFKTFVNAANTSEPLTDIQFSTADTTPPTVASVTPAGAGAAISGNVVITFSEAMDATPGAVQLNSLTALTGGAWSGGNTVFTIPYSGLAYSTSFTVKISGFKDAAGNTMAANNSNLFTTVSAPVYSLTVSASAGGAVSGTTTGNYTAGTAVSVTANPAVGYRFISWTVSGATITGGNTVNPAKFSMPTGAVTLKAIFELIPPPTYGVSISAFTGGSVSADKANYETGETVTLTIVRTTGYELFAISACKTGDAATVVALSGSGDTRTFKMPTYGVTVTATFHNPDAEAVADAKSLIEGTGNRTVAQATANTEATVKTWLVSQINALIVPNGITVTQANITISGFKAAVAGTSGTPAGTNGAFNFTVSLAKGGSSLTTTGKAGTITATPYVAPTNYAVTISGTANGTVTANPASAPAGTVITLTIAPTVGYELNAISANKTGDATTAVSLSGTGNSRTFAMPNYDVTVTATFKKIADQTTVEAAKSLIESGSYTVAQATANTQAAVKTWLASQINTLIDANGITITDANITLSGFTAAVAGTSGTPAGTNGAFNFTVSLAKGGSSLITTGKAGTITATPYVAPTNYAVTISGTANGTVTANPASAPSGTSITLTITPASGFELASISVTKVDDAKTTVTLSGTGNTRTFTMPAYGVTVTATFKKTQAQLDQEAVDEAKEAVEGGTFCIAQATGNAQESVRTWLINTLNLLFGQTHNLQFRSATEPIFGDVTITAITPAVAGTETSPDGIDGSFIFTVTLTKGESAFTTNEIQGVIVATPYTATPTGIDNLQTCILKAYVQNGTLYVSGLTAGKAWSVYNISGVRLLQDIAKDEKANFVLPVHGVYIVKMGNQSLKVLY